MISNSFLAGFCGGMFAAVLLTAAIGPAPIFSTVLLGIGAALATAGIVAGSRP